MDGFVSAGCDKDSLPEPIEPGSRLRLSRPESGSCEQSAKPSLSDFREYTGNSIDRAPSRSSFISSATLQIDIILNVTAVCAGRMLFGCGESGALRARRSEAKDSLFLPRQAFSPTALWIWSSVCPQHSPPSRAWRSLKGSKPSARKSPLHAVTGPGSGWFPQWGRCMPAISA